jgi:Ca2+-binding EF-hand superfamily protein
MSIENESTKFEQKEQLSNPPSARQKAPPPISNPALRKTKSRLGNRGTSRKYGKYTPSSSIVRPETVMGVISYSLPRRSESRMKLTPLGQISPRSQSFFARSAQLQSALTQSRKSRTSQQNRRQTKPRRLAELKNKTVDQQLQKGENRPSTTMGIMKSASASFLTGVDAGGPSEFGDQAQAGHVMYQKAGPPPASQQSVSWGDLPNLHETRAERNQRLQLEREEKARAQSPHHFPGSSLKVHEQFQDPYDSDLDNSSADERELEQDLLTPSYPNGVVGMEEEKKYFGASGRDSLFAMYKSVSTKRELRRNGVKMETLYDINRPQSPGRTYVENCLRMRMTPEPMIVRDQPTDTHLSLAHMGIGNRRLSAVADSIGALPNLHHLDVTDCRISDKAFIRLLMQAEQRPPDDALLSLKMSDNHLSHGGVQQVAKFLEHSITDKSMGCHLMTLTLSNCQLSDRVATQLCKAMRENQTVTCLNLSNNALGVEAGHSIGKMLARNCVLTDLDISWNNIRDDGAGSVAQHLCGSSIRNLNMAYNAFGRCQSAAMLGKWLPHTKVEHLDMTANHLTPLTVSILMNGLALFPTLQSVKLDENPIGMLGTAAVLRSFGRCSYDSNRPNMAVTSIYQCSCDIRIDMDTAQQTKGNSKMSSFDFHEPAGSYELNLEIPADYALACEILFIANTRRKVDLRSVKYAKPGTTKMKQIKLIRSDGDKSDFMTKPPGYLIEKKTKNRFHIPEDGVLSMVVKVRPHQPKFYDIVKDEVYQQVLSIIKEPHTDPNRLAIARAACEGYIFTVSQIQEILQTFRPDQRHDLVPSFMLRLVSGEETNRFIDENRHYLHGAFNKFYPTLPTGRYVIDMSSVSDRALFKRLMEISNDERQEEIKAKIKDDMSQLGDRSGFRNVTWKNEPFEVTGMIDEVEDVPRDGTIILDFVSRKIQKLDTPPLTEEEEGTMPEECLLDLGKYKAWIHDKCVNVRWVRDYVLFKQPKPSDWMTLDQKITALFNLLDEDGGGEVDKMEVMKAIIERPEVGDFMCQIPELEPLLEPRTFGPAFDAIDQDGGGSLDLDEFRQMCGIATDIAEVAEAMFEADSDSDWDEQEDEELRNRLKALVSNKLNMAHKQLRQQMSNGTTEERLNAVRELFDNCDVGEKEYLMPEEFAQLTASLGIVLSATELQEAVETIDEDGNGQIEVDEYLEWWGDEELIELYEKQQEAIESGKPYKCMGQQFASLNGPGRLEKVNKLFDECDVGAKGYLQPWEFAKLSSGLGVKLTPTELAKAVEEIDEDGNGQIEVDEYLEWWGDQELIGLYSNQQDALESGKPYRVMGEQLAKGTALERLAVVRKLFDDMDEGNKEYLDPEEFGKLSAVLGVKLGAAELKEAILEIDEDGNGQIEVDEYLAWWGDQELIDLYEENPDAEVSAQNWCFAQAWLDSLDEEPEEIDRTGAGDKGRLAREEVKKDIDPEELCNRVNWVVATLNRLVDLHKFHLLWDHLSERERDEVLYKLGWLTVFDPVSPERRFYMNLSNREQQVVASCLVKLAIIEPGENWLYEGYKNPNPIPGWQLPVSWTTAIPSQGELKLTYSSTSKGCAPVWDERVKLRRICLIPEDAPIPSVDDLIWGSESDKLMSYVAFVRLMSDEVHVLRTITKARKDLFAKRNRNEDEDDEESEEEDSDGGDSDGGGSDAEGGVSAEPSIALSTASKSGLDGGASVITNKTNKTDKSGKAVDGGESQILGEDEQEEEIDWETMMPLEKYARMTILLLEECRANFLKSSKETDDLEEALGEEWVNFANLTRIRFEDHPDMRTHFQELGAMFDELGW